MKFDPRSPRAWTVFAASLASLVVASLVAALLDLIRWSRPRTRRLVLFSHAYAGNVRAIVEHADPARLSTWEVRYLHLSPRSAAAHDDQSVQALLAMRPWQALWAARADVVLTTHGPGILRILMLLRPRIRWADVWHGVPYKQIGYVQGTRGVDKLLVASQALRDYWVRQGVDPQHLEVTGHPLWDALSSVRSRQEIIEATGLGGPYRAHVLVAPTWTGDRLGVQRKALGSDWQELIPAINDWARELGVLVIFRSHLNAGMGLEERYDHVVNVPYASYPITADLLMISNALVTDWSAIALDFLPTGRPLIYLDVPPPGDFSFLQSSDRPGLCVSTLDDLLAALTEAVLRPEDHTARYEIRRREVVEKVCGSMADGNASTRCLAVLDRLAPGR